MSDGIMRKHMKERLGVVNNYCQNPELPKSLNIELNSTCNQACIFCPFHGKYAPSIPKLTSMDLEDVKKLLLMAHELGIGKKEVGFYLAGEAFLYKELPEVISYAKKLGFQYTFLTTNGALATPEKMKAVLDAGLDSLRISINATDRETYKEIHGRDDFEKVLQNLKFMHEYIIEKSLNIATSISCVVTKRTIGIQKDFREMFGAYVEDILFIPVMLQRLVQDEKFIDEYQLMDDRNTEMKQDFICPLLFDTMYINANLEVVPCCEAYDTNCIFYDLKKDFSLENAWNSKEYMKYRQMFLEQENFSNTLCDQCTLRLKGIERFSLE